MTPAHIYVPRCRHGRLIGHAKPMDPMFVMTDLNPQGERWWYCDRCGRVRKDAWN